MSTSEAEKYRAILEKDPTDTQAFVGLCSIAEGEGDYEYLAELYRFRAQVIKDSKEIADLFYKAGEVFLEKLDDLNRGVEAMLQGFDYDRTHAGIGDRLDEIYREAEDWEATLQILEQRLDALSEGDPDGTKNVIRSDLHQQAGEIWERIYGDSDRAIDHYLKAIDLDKTNLLALYNAREIYYAAGKYKNAAKLCELEARAEKNAERRVALYRELANLLHKHLNEPAQAVLALKRGLKIDSSNAEVKLTLAQTIAEVPLSEENLKDHKWASEHLLRLARNSNIEDALEYGKYSLMAYPTNLLTRDFLENKAVEDGAIEELAAVYQQIISLKKELAEQAPIIRYLAKLYLHHLKMPENAINWMRKLEPLGIKSDLRAIDRLSKGVVTSITDPEDLAPPVASEKREDEETTGVNASSMEEALLGAGMDQEQELEQEDEQAARPVDVDEPPTPISQDPLEASHGSELPPDGKSAEEYIIELRQLADKARRTGDDEATEGYMLRILDFKPSDQKAATYMERRYRAKSDWVSLRDILLRSHQAEHLPLAVQTVRLREAARISEDQLGDIEGAIKAWRIIRTNDPKVRDAGDALIRLLSEAERWEELLEILELEVEATKNRTKKIEGYRRIAEIYRTQLGNIEAAAGAYKKVREFSQDDTGALEALDKIYGMTEDYTSLVPLLRSRAELSRDRDEKREFLLRAAKALDEYLQNPEEAYLGAKEILTICPDDEEALDMMERLDERLEKWTRLQKTLNLRANAAKAPAEKAKYLHKKALVALNQLNDIKSAVHALEEVLDIAPDDVKALDLLAELHSNAGDWEQLIEVYKRRLEAVTEQSAKIEIHRQIARVLENELVRPDDAMEFWNKVLEIEEDVESLGALARYYERIQDWAELVEVLERQANLAEVLSVRAGVLYRKASLLDEKLGERDQAVSTLNRVLDEVDPTHVDTLSLLENILVGDSDFERATKVLERRIAYTEDPDQLRELYLRLGAWYRSELGDLESAMEAYEQVTRLEPTDNSVAGILDEIYTSLKEWDKLLTLIQDQIENEPADEKKMELIIRAGQLCETELQNFSRAWTWYRTIFTSLSHLDNALNVVDEAARRMELWQELIDEIYGVMTRNADDVNEQVTWWLKIADVFEEKLEDSPKALEAVLRAFGLTPDDRNLLDRVDRLAALGESWDRLSTVYGVLIGRAANTQGKIGLFLRFAKLLFDTGSNASRAFDVALKAFELRPNDNELLNIVEQYGTKAERWEDLVRVYSVCSRLEKDVEHRIDLRLKAVAILRDHLQDRDNALQHLFEMVRTDPVLGLTTENVWPEIRILEQKLEEDEKGTCWKELIEVYRHCAIEAKDDRPRKAAILSLISSAHLEELGQPDQAFSALIEAHRLVPRDENVIGKLEFLAGDNDLWQHLVDHYRDVLDETFEMDVAIMLHRKRSRILEEELGRLDEAAEHYWQIIQLDASDVTGYVKLRNYYAQAEKWNELVNILERQLDNTEKDEEKRDTILEIAKIWETRIGNRFEAQEWYEQVVAMWPDDEVASEALKRLQSESKGDNLGDEDGDEDDDDISELISIPPPPAEDPDDLEDGEDEEDEDDDDISDLISIPPPADPTVAKGDDAEEPTESTVADVGDESGDIVDSFEKIGDEQTADGGIGESPLEIEEPIKAEVSGEVELDESAIGVAEGPSVDDYKASGEESLSSLGLNLDDVDSFEEEEPEQPQFVAEGGVDTVMQAPLDRDLLATLGDEPIDDDTAEHELRAAAQLAAEYVEEEETEASTMNHAERAGQAMYDIPEEDSFVQKGLPNLDDEIARVSDGFVDSNLEEIDAGDLIVEESRISHKLAGAEDEEIEELDLDDIEDASEDIMDHLTEEKE